MSLWGEHTDELQFEIDRQAAEIEQLRAENERLRAALANLGDEWNCNQEDACLEYGSEFPMYHHEDCPVYGAWAALNPEPAT